MNLIKKRIIILIINFFIKIGKVIEIYNLCDYDCDYFFFEIAITITIKRTFYFQNRDYDYYFDCQSKR